MYDAASSFTVAELFEKMIQCDGDVVKIKQIFKKYNTKMLEMALFYLFDPNVFFVVKVPKYKPSTAMYGYQDQMFNHVFNSIKYLIEGTGESVDEIRAERMLCGFLEGLHANDAKLLEMMIRREQPKIKGLDKDLINEIYPDLLTEVTSLSLDDFFVS